MPQALRERIFSVNENSFDLLALDVFRYQFSANPVYAAFCNGINRNPANVNSVAQIPFLPVEVFKSHDVYAASRKPGTVFTSSGTTGMITSRHPVADLSLYEESFLRGFRLFYGEPSGLVILALLPSYLEREGSSLVYMADRLIRESGRRESGFYLHDYEALAGTLKALEAAKQKTILLGVTYALLDLAEKFPVKLEHTVIMETGGMKGKRKEMIREELHGILTNAFGVKTIHSEYGMTELLSQAYSSGEGIFHCPPWMKILIREMNDPFSFAGKGQTGGVNIIDLANLYSCSFIATSDLGKQYEDGSFEILGRFDFSDVRGCNLMVE
jgi:phenylacetate-coenzyme A ligase PaaK-like adenylate-forming protein